MRFTCNAGELGRLRWERRARDGAELPGTGSCRVLVAAGASRPVRNEVPARLRSTKIAFACRGTQLPAQGCHARAAAYRR